ncbi:hypothetical protein F4818DRAFT_418463 [Hypoxylon cercidicola]|nr:hypothetical protein F4818DRAFT_418463 [Hypoxylon cercidicola]
MHVRPPGFIEIFFPRVLVSLAVFELAHQSTVMWAGRYLGLNLGSQSKDVRRMLKPEKSVRINARDGLEDSGSVWGDELFRQVGHDQRSRRAKISRTRLRAL